MNAAGSAQTRLVIIRGNSGSGKSALAMAVRKSLPRGVAIIGQDLLRRNILHVRDQKGLPAVDFIDLSARFALDRGFHVIVEGILHEEIYGDMLRALVSDHRGMTRCYRFNVPFIVRSQTAGRSRRRLQEVPTRRYTDFAAAELVGILPWGRWS